MRLIMLIDLNLPRQWYHSRENTIVTDFALDGKLFSLCSDRDGTAGGEPIRGPYMGK